ncbi:uncharacterized protein LOC144871927 [Branchiostoma floridae x Branchiostoma japonicum]
MKILTKSATNPGSKMLRICKELREVDAKAKKHGPLRAEVDYIRALLHAMTNMDTLLEVEVLKSLSDANLEQYGKLKNVLKINRAKALYRTALHRCEDKEIKESLEYRLSYVEKLRPSSKEVRIENFNPLASRKSVSQVSSLVRVAEKLSNLDRRLTVGFDKSSLLIEYTKLMIEGIVNEDNILETEAIKSLGDVYLKRGTENKDTTCLTKATALYNTALARCEGVQGAVALIHRLLYMARIRQDMRKTANKGPKYRRQQSQRHHLSRDLPGMSCSSDVMAGRGDQQFMSAGAAYIASQTSRRAAPDYRTYEKHLTTGDRGLTDGNLDLAEQEFASALKVIHDKNEPDRRREADCLCRLGDVYLHTAKRTKEGRKFTQAAALYNAALARTDKNTHKVKKRLHDVEKSFLCYTANVDSEPSPSDSAISHQKRLEDMRSSAKTQLEAIDQQHNPYQYDDDDPKMLPVEAERSEAMKALCKSIAKGRQIFIQALIDECISTIGPPLCKFIGLGSQATELVTPYSDLEFAILIEEGKDNDNTRRYFINLTHYLHLKVINLGETILPAMAIPSLNDFHSEDPDKDWFFDSVTPHGFAFDGFMPWASKTPFGRDQTKSKAPISLIQTPSEMAKFQQLEISLAEGYNLSDILMWFVFLAGDEELVKEYMEILKTVIKDDLLSHIQTRRLLVFAMQPLLESMGKTCAFEPTGPLLNITQKDLEKIGQIPDFWPTGQLLDVKKDIYRFPGIAIDLLALFCNIALSASTWDVIDEIKEAGWIHKEDAKHLTVLTSISAELRLRTYMANGGQKDSLSPLPEIEYQTKMLEVSNTTLKSAFHIPDIKVLFRYYCRAMPLRMCMLDIIQEQDRKLPAQPRRVFETAIFDASNECMGRIAGSLCLFNKSIHHLEAALKDAGMRSDMKKLSKLLSELGSCWRVMGDHKTAMRYHEKFLTITESLIGNTKPHTYIAGALNNLGLCWHGLGDYRKTIEYWQKSLAMMKTIYGDKTAHPDIAMLLTNLGLAWQDCGDQEKAISYLEQSLTMLKTIYGETHQDIARTLLNLGTSWLRNDNHERAKEYCERSLTMRKAIYGDNTAHPDIAMSLHNLGVCWKTIGDQRKAIMYFEDALTMRKTNFGDRTPHPDIAKALYNLGLCWDKIGDKKKAISYFEQSLTMRKAIYRESTPHPDTAMSLHSLGSCWLGIGNQQKAIIYLEQSLTIRKAFYGDNTPHPDIATSLYNIGVCWSAIGDQKKAISYYDQSLTMRKAFYGDNSPHPDIATSLENLGVCWARTGKEKKAIVYFQKALTMRKTIFGENTPHPDIAMSLHNLGECWSAMGDQEKAIVYFRKTQTMRKTIFGENTPHPDIAMSLHSLGKCWSAMGDQEKAIVYFKKTLAMRQTIFGENTTHPDIAKSLDSLGVCWSAVGNKKKAIVCFEKALTMRKTSLGENTPHPDIAKSLFCMEVCWDMIGDQKKAISYLEQSLTMRKAFYGHNTPHPDITTSLHSLGDCWSAIGDQERAIVYYEKALTMRKAIFGEKSAHPDISALLNDLAICWDILGYVEKANSYSVQALIMEAREAAQ